MRNMREKRAVVVLAIVAFVLAACATTPLGKAVQGAHIQKQLVEASAVEFIKLHMKGAVSDADYAKGKEAYAKWAAGEDALAKSLADWKRLGDTPSSDRLGAALRLSGELFRVYSTLIGKFVDLGALRATLSK